MLRLFPVGCVLLLFALIAGLFTSPAMAQGPGQVTLENPPGAEAKKEGPPNTSGPLITDTCVPIEAHHLSLQLNFDLTFYPANSTSNWRRVSFGSDFHTFYMPLKITYGLMKNWETYVVIPYAQQWISSSNVRGPNGNTSASYAGIDDISWFNKYLLHEETDSLPAVSGVFGVGFPSGHASHINRAFLGTDAVGTGSFAFTTGFNLYKYLKPLLLYSNVWYTAPVNLFQDRPDMVRSKEYVTFNLAAEYPLTPKWIMLMEWFSIWTWTNISTPGGYLSPYTYMGILGGMEYQLSDKWAFTAGIQYYLAAKQGAIYLMPMLSLNYNF